MSHISRLQLVVQDEECLKKAIEDLGYTVLDGYFYNYGGSKATTYNGQDVVCGIDTGQGSRRFGFVREKDGSIRLVGDSYNTGLNVSDMQKRIGCRYALHLSAKQLRKQGFTSLGMPQYGGHKKAKGKVTMEFVKSF